MTLSEYIKELQKLEERGLGDLDVIYNDGHEEGNYDFVNEVPVAGYWDYTDFDDSNEEPNAVVIN